MTVETLEEVEELGELEEVKEVSIVSMIPHNWFLQVEKIRQNGGHDPCHPRSCYCFMIMAV